MCFEKDEKLQFNQLGLKDCIYIIVSLIKIALQFNQLGLKDEYGIWKDSEVSDCSLTS